LECRVWGRGVGVEGSGCRGEGMPAPRASRWTTCGCPLAPAVGDTKLETLEGKLKATNPKPHLDPKPQGLGLHLKWVSLKQSP